ncbi:MAG TPA: hypothetical protein DCZ01_05170 [Elusimicrobia bacterium]|nr:hypothetical protein [Elusimicrobiota bacterium]
MEKNKNGWGQRAIDALYTGYGFILRQGGKHRIYTHPFFPQLHQAVSRQNDLPPGYAQSALKLIAELERLTAAQTTIAAAPATGPPAVLTLADLSILLSSTEEKAAKTMTAVEPILSLAAVVVAANTAPAVPPIRPTLSPATPKIVAVKAEPPAAARTPPPRGWVETLLERIFGTAAP